jgi:hypothetical protein
MINTIKKLEIIEFVIPILGSKGIDPKKGIFVSSAIFFAPPVVGANIIDSPYI